MKNALLALLLAFGGLSLTACGEPDGPAERPGEEIDEAIDNAEGAVEEIGEDLEDAAEEAEPN